MGTGRVTHRSLEVVSGRESCPGNTAPPARPHFLVSLPTCEGRPVSPAVPLLTVLARAARVTVVTTPSLPGSLFNSALGVHSMQPGPGDDPRHGSCFLRV